MIFQKILWIPVWLIVLLLKPFLPKNHIWKCKNLKTIDLWINYGTDAAFWFNIFIWWQIILFVILIGIVKLK